MFLIIFKVYGHIYQSSSLAPMVPGFIGRKGECEKIIQHVTSESTGLVSIWGSPGIGKHQLQLQ